MSRIEQLPYYRATIRLVLVVPQPADSNGYVRTNESEVAEIVLTGGSEESTLRQALNHVTALRSTYALTKSADDS